MLEEGVKALNGVSDYTAPKLRIDFGSAESLAPFEREYAFYTPALLYLFGRFYDGPLNDFSANHKLENCYMYHKFDAPIFSGFSNGGPPDWNYALWAMRREHWSRFESFILSLAFHHPSERNVIRFGVQHTEVLDPLAVSRSHGVVDAAKAPLVKISVFGVNASWGCVATDRVPVDPPLSRERLCAMPRMRMFAPLEHMLRFAAAISDSDFTAASDSMEAPAAMPREATPFNVVDVGDVSAEKQAEVAKLIQWYRSEA